jgi:predicted  nucleic acid-binding Zn-ribbon protein
MARGELLHKLQHLDTALDDSHRRVSEIQAALGETDALGQAREALVAAEAEHRKWMARAHELELEIESLSNKVNSSENRLYSGSVSNPKELSDIQDEVVSLKRRRGDLEDELLEAMVYGEDAGAELEASRTNLAEIETNWQTNQTALKEELGDLEERLSSIHREREQLRLTIPADELALYDKARSRYGSIAVTTLRDGVCGYCAVAPSSTKLGRLRSGRELLQCGNCGRILLNL